MELVVRVWHCKYGDARLEPQHQNSYQNIEPSEICIKSELGTLVSRSILDLDLLIICKLFQSVFYILHGKRIKSGVEGSFDQGRKN